MNVTYYLFTYRLTHFSPYIPSNNFIWFVFGNYGNTVLLPLLFLKEHDFVEGMEGRFLEEMRKVDFVYFAPFPLSFCLALRKPPTLEGSPAMMLSLHFTQLWIPISSLFLVSLRGCIGKIILVNSEIRSDLKIFFGGEIMI